MSEEKKKNKSGFLTPVKSVFSAFSLRTKIIILAVIAVAFSFGFPIICNIVGSNFGKAVGSAVGSFKAVTVDMPQAYNQGKEDGLSAIDTKTEIQNSLKEIGKLDVLAATGNISNVNRVGEKYAALFEFGADVIVSVDLSQAEVLAGDSSIQIRLPKPVAEINIDSTRTKLRDVWQRGVFNGTTEDGLKEYLNTIDKLQKNAKESLDNYDWLISQAEKSARDHVTKLASYATQNSKAIEVLFKEMGGEQQ